MTTNQPGNPDQDWTVRLRLAIDADNADDARAIAEEVLRTMDVVADTEPRLTPSAGRARYWNIVTDLDLSGLMSITPDDAPTRVKYVIRNLDGVTFSRPATGDRNTGLWQWLPDSWEMTGRHQELAHPAVRAAGILVSAPQAP